MTHEEFVDRCLRANAGDRSPSLSSLTEEEAVARWMAFLTMCHVRVEHEAESRGGAVPSVTHVWRRWGRGGSEDVDMAMRVARFKVQVQPDVDGYFFRLSDYGRRQWFDAKGRTVRERGRLRISLTQYPDTWTMVGRAGTGRAESGRVSFRPAACCRRALAEIRRIVRSMQGVQALLSAGQFAGLFSMVTSPGVDSPEGVVESLSSVYDLQDSDWEMWARAMASVPDIQREGIRSVAFGEVENHYNEPARERFWAIVYESGAAR